MARLATAPPRRVSHLVGRFEQLSNSESLDRYSGYSADDERPRSHHGETSLSLAISSRKDSTSPLDRRAFSLGPMSSEATGSTEALLSEERKRCQELQEEIELLRKRNQENDKLREALINKIEQGDLAKQGYEDQRKYMERKFELMRQRLASRDERTKAEHDRAEAEMLELQQQLYLSETTRQEELENGRVKLQRERNMLAIQLRDAENRAEEALRSAKEFESQLLSLKQIMSASNRLDEQASDQEIMEKLGTLNHEVQNWVVNVFRKFKIDDPSVMGNRFKTLSLLSGSNLLRSLYHDFDNSGKLFAFQGTVVYLIMRVFENDFFFGFPEVLQSLQTAVKVVKSPSPAYNEWRSQTFLFLQRAEGHLKEMIDAAAEERKSNLVVDISMVLSTLTDIKLDKNQLTSLGKVIERAISLSRTLGVQRSVYECILPDYDASDELMFDHELMEDVLDIEDTRERPVRCVTFPALLKTGDELGDHMETQNIVMKARVLCRMDENDDVEDEEDDTISDYF